MNGTLLDVTVNTWTSLIFLRTAETSSAQCLYYEPSQYEDGEPIKTRENGPITAFSELMEVL